MENFSTSVESDLKKIKHIPSVWVEEWGREVGIFGVATVENPSDIPKGNETNRRRAGLDDSLDAFRHAFMSAVLVSWMSTLSSGQVSPDLARLLVDILGRLNELSAIGGKSAEPCAKAMDLHNNEVGRKLSLDSSRMMEILARGENPNRVIAERVAEAVRSGELITRFDDPRMPKECHLKAKVRGKYFVWKSQGDEKVRWSHRMRNGRVFAWNELPAGELPGQEVNCRCTAELLTEAQQKVIDERRGGIFKK